MNPVFSPLSCPQEGRDHTTHAQYTQACQVETIKEGEAEGEAEAKIRDGSDPRPHRDLEPGLKRCSCNDRLTSSLRGKRGHYTGPGERRGLERAKAWRLERAFTEHRKKPVL